MDSIAATALGQLDASGKGIHVLWLGAPAFLFAPGGWIVERRIATQRDVRSSCDVLNTPALAHLRQVLELRATQGVWSWREGRWPADPGTKSEVLTFEFEGERRGIHGRVAASRAFIIGFLRDKATAFAGPLVGAFDLGSNAVDRVVLHTVGPSSVQICVYEDDAVQWTGATRVAELQVPIREFMPSLSTPQAEFEEATRRLLPGETLDEVRFRDYTDMLRTALRDTATSPRQRVLLMRDDSGEPFEELSALDPVRMLYADPTWRRVLGLALFDRDPALVPGTRYDYRITGRFPALEVASRWFGFHTIPAGTALPAEFYLHDCMLRPSEPTLVQRSPEIDESGSLLASRRGIALASRGSLGWAGLGIEDASLIIDFGTPATVIVLDIARGHTLRYQAGDPWSPFPALTPVPPGPRAVLTFAAPVSQLRLFGHGFLYGFRFTDAVASDADGMVALRTTMLDVLYADAPRPDPPLSLTAGNLQVPHTAPGPAPRHQIGVALAWTPAPVAGLPFWPPGAGAAPLDATTFQIERKVEPDGAFTPVLGVRNRLLGTSAADAPDPEVHSGVDLMQVFPEQGAPGASSNSKQYQDIFLVGDGSGSRTPPPLGSMLVYRVRALDTVGRPSHGWTVASPVRLEKHEAPPLPAAPSETPADEFVQPAPTGVTARAIVRGDPALTAADQVLLGASANAVVLNWGWHARERALDPYANQFRLYLARPLDGIDGQIGSVGDVMGQPGAYVVVIILERAVTADAAKGLYLDAGAPFFIEMHGGGTTIQATVRTRVPQGPGGSFRKPLIGPVRLPLRLTADTTRPTKWAERLEVQPGLHFMPITAATTYQFVLRDRLHLDDDHPRDSLWLGVTAADSEAYVADTFPQMATGSPLPGNESAVAFAQCQATLMRRPTFSPPHALAPVPRVVAPEPVDGPVRFSLDLLPHLAGMGLTAGELVKPERLSVSDLLAALRTDNGRIFAEVVERRSVVEAEQELTLPNPGDHALLVTGLAAGDATRIDDRIAVYVAGIHPYADRLFTEATTSPVPLAPFTETLHPGGGRYVYRVRKANAAGRTSPRGAIAKVVVRVPSLMPGAPPRREPRQAGDAPGLLRLTVPRDSRARAILVFELAATADTDLAGVQLLRLPNRHDLAVVDVVRLRSAEGALIPPRSVVFDENLSDSGALRARLTLAGGTARRRAVWACSITEDGIPSTLAGPWLVRFPSA